MVDVDLRIILEQIQRLLFRRHLLSRLESRSTSLYLLYRDLSACWAGHSRYFWRKCFGNDTEAIASVGDLTPQKPLLLPEIYHLRSTDLSRHSTINAIQKVANEVMGVENHNRSSHQVVLLVTLNVQHSFNSWIYMLWAPNTLPTFLIIS